MSVVKGYGSRFPLEYCALRFLVQWLRREKALYLAVSSNPTEEDIRKALSYFVVSRNFTGLRKEPQKIGIIRNALIEVRNSQQLSDGAKVERLASDLEKPFKKRNLSASSKLLWLSLRERVAIYDSRAVKALSGKFKHKFDKRSYQEYLVAWRSQYLEMRAAIEAAVKEIPKARTFMPACPLTDEALVTLSSENWFKERVFDIFLWEVGGDDL
jgi:hypothetical protein